MKALRTLTNLLLFGTMLILGLHAGRTTAATMVMVRPAPTPGFTPLPPTPAEVTLPGNHQRNLLVIGVDSLTNSPPRLEGIWLVLYIQDFPQITLLPIYPQTTGTKVSVEDSPLKEHFRINQDGSLDPSFVDALEANQVWWNAYVILDQIALEHLIQWSNQIQKGEGKALSIDELPNAWEDPDGALAGQQKLAQKLCLVANVFSFEGDGPVKDFASSHFLTDLDLKEAAEELQKILLDHQKVVCEFPTFSVPGKN